MSLPFDFPRAVPGTVLDTVQGDVPDNVRRAHSSAPAAFAQLHIALVAPLPPPSGGMANQALQLSHLLQAEGAKVTLVQVNPPYWPSWVGHLKGVRAAFRLASHVRRLWSASGRVDLVHVMANSGWSWHLYAAPAIWIAHLRRVPVIVNYRGGEADVFFARQMQFVAPSLQRASAILVPSQYLCGVFEKYGFKVQIVPNIIDLARFSPDPGQLASVTTSVMMSDTAMAPSILVARNLEAIYDNASALRAFALFRQHHPDARLVIAGAGSLLQELQQLAQQLGITAAVQFTGRLDNPAMASLYRACTMVLNPSLADNMPISMLEALASNKPVVSTNVGGIPALLEHEVTALLVEPGNPVAMAQAMLRLLDQPGLARSIAQAGHAHVQQFCWQHVAPRWLAQYLRVACAPQRSGTHQTNSVNTHSLHTLLISKLLFPLHEKGKRHTTVRVLRQMETSQWWTPDQIEQQQLQRLRALLLHAEKHVPYYRQLFGKIGFDPAKLQNLAQLALLPVLVKAGISAARDDFKADNARHLARFTTGGSSGEPLVFYIGKQRVSHDVAAKWRATRWWGVDIGDPEIVLWGSPIELKAQDRLRLWRDKALRSTLLPAFDMSKQKIDGYIEEIRRIKPKMLFGYPSALSHIARHASLRQIPMNELGIRVAFVTSERLYEEQRAIIEAVFGCPVANGYGGRDAGFIAHECPHGGMHITAEDIIVEIVGANGQGVPKGATGSIIVTHLATADFPFIRYATGDIGALDTEPCPCGRGLPLLKAIEGRSTDFLVAQDGTAMHGLALVYVLRDLPQIRAFKIIQESVHQTRVLLVALPLLDAATRALIEQRFKARLGAGVDIVIDEVLEIAAEASGKFRYVVSKVAPI